MKKINFNKTQYVNSSVSRKTYPEDLGKEVAIVGRSNVGKSSLINKLTGYKRLAKVSKTPGRTQCINFFDIEYYDITDYPLRLVDLPGYGYAKAAKTSIRSWNKLIRNYLKGRPNLMRVLLLIDSRHGIKANDLEIMQMLDEAAVTYQIVLTKVDKVKGAVELNIKFEDHGALYPEVLMTSSFKSEGIEEVQAVIAEFANS